MAKVESLIPHRSVAELIEAAEGEVELARSEALKELHGLFRSQLLRRREAWERTRSLPPEDAMLTAFFDRITRQIWESESPAKKLKEITSGRAKLGRPVKNGERDFDIAVSIHRHIQNGLTIEQASQEIADLEKLSPERCIAIYKAQRKTHDISGLAAEAGFINEQIANSAKTKS